MKHYVIEIRRCLDPETHKPVHDHKIAYYIDTKDRVRANAPPRPHGYYWLPADKNLRAGAEALRQVMLASAHEQVEGLLKDIHFAAEKEEE